MYRGRHRRSYRPASGKERALDPRESPLGIQHIRLCGYTDQGSKCVEKVNKQEREYDNDEFQYRNTL